VAEEVHADALEPLEAHRVAVPADAGGQHLRRVPHRRVRQVLGAARRTPPARATERVPPAIPTADAGDAARRQVDGPARGRAPRRLVPDGRRPRSTAGRRRSR
jgi:hypothetical protein